jgi:hypothetical protein
MTGSGGEPIPGASTPRHGKTGFDSRTMLPQVKVLPARLRST